MTMARRNHIMKDTMSLWSFLFFILENWEVYWMNKYVYILYVHTFVYIYICPSPEIIT